MIDTFEYYIQDSVGIPWTHTYRKGSMKRRTIATIANFFLPGLGYLIGGIKQGLAILWLVGAFGLTYVEFGIREPEPTLYWLMFASVLVMNSAFAIDVHRSLRPDARQPNSGVDAASAV